MNLLPSLANTTLVTISRMNEGLGLPALGYSAPAVPTTAVDCSVEHDYVIPGGVVLRYSCLALGLGVLGGSRGPVSATGLDPPASPPAPLSGGAPSAGLGLLRGLTDRLPYSYYQVDYPKTPDTLACRCEPQEISIPSQNLGGATQSCSSIERFERRFPKHQRCWITKSATAISRAINFVTNRTIDYLNLKCTCYIEQSSRPAVETTMDSAPRSRAFTLLASERTRKHLSFAYALSDLAAERCSESVALVDATIRTTCAYMMTRVPSGRAKPDISAVSRLILSADLIASTVEESKMRFKEMGAYTFDKVVCSQYGPHVTETSKLMFGTASNVWDAYNSMKGVEMRGVVESICRELIMSMVKDPLHGC